MGYLPWASGDGVGREAAQKEAYLFWTLNPSQIFVREKGRTIIKRAERA